MCRVRIPPAQRVVPAHYEILLRQKGLVGTTSNPPILFDLQENRQGRQIDRWSCPDRNYFRTLRPCDGSVLLCLGSVRLNPHPEVESFGKLQCLPTSGDR